MLSHVTLTYHQIERHVDIIETCCEANCLPSVCGKLNDRFAILNIFIFKRRHLFDR